MKVIIDRDHVSQNGIDSSYALKITLRESITDQHLKIICADLEKLFRDQKDTILDNHGYCIDYFGPITVELHDKTIILYTFMTSSAIKRNGCVSWNNSFTADENLFWTGLMVDYCSVAAGEYFAD